MDEKLIKASKDILACLHQSFEIMNWFAKGDHHYVENKNGEKQLCFGRTDTEAILAEVYSTLASSFGPFKQAVNEINEQQYSKTLDLLEGWLDKAAKEGPGSIKIKKLSTHKWVISNETS